MLTDEIAACCKALKLSRNIVDMAERVEAESHPGYLLKILRSELEHRESQRRDKFLKSAGFYSIKTMDGFRFDEVTLPAEVSVDYLRNCEFINTKTNLVMYGNVGTGKTFLSIALGVEACKRGIETRFFRTAALVNRLSEAKKNGTLSVFMKKLAKAELLICDLCCVIGYVELIGGLRSDLSVLARFQ